MLYKGATESLTEIPTNPRSPRIEQNRPGKNAYPRAPKAEAFPDPRNQRPILPDHYRHLIKGPTIPALWAEDSAHLVSDLPAGLTPERPPAQ